eukprot:11322903-Ditylum_brightwellii.AAC.1
MGKNKEEAEVEVVTIGKGNTKGNKNTVVMIHPRLPIKKEVEAEVKVRNTVVMIHPLPLFLSTMTKIKI